MYGTISMIPADHSVEVRDLIVGTQYRIEEKDSEIPKGYTRRLGDGYTRVDVTPELCSEDPYTDTIQSGESPRVEVRNQKGWGLTIEKRWTDADFVPAHDPVYFGVYIDGPAGEVRSSTGFEGDVHLLLLR